jgi:hypothetical protein
MTAATKHIAIGKRRATLAAARFPVMPPKRINQLCDELRSPKEMYEFHDRRFARADNDTEPPLADVRDSWADNCELLPGVW